MTVSNCCSLRVPYVPALCSRSNPLPLNAAKDGRDWNMASPGTKRERPTALAARERGRAQGTTFPMPHSFLSSSIQKSMVKLGHTNKQGRFREKILSSNSPRAMPLHSVTGKLKLSDLWVLRDGLGQGTRNWGRHFRAGPWITLSLFSAELIQPLN